VAAAASASRRLLPAAIALALEPREARDDAQRVAIPHARDLAAARMDGERGGPGTHRAGRGSRTTFVREAAKSRVLAHEREEPRFTHEPRPARERVGPV
jgi:hypothetical protein